MVPVCARSIPIRRILDNASVRETTEIGTTVKARVSGVAGWNAYQGRDLGRGCLRGWSWGPSAGSQDRGFPGGPDHPLGFCSGARPRDGVVIWVGASSWVNNDCVWFVNMVSAVTQLPVGACPSLMGNLAGVPA